MKKRTGKRGLKQVVVSIIEGVGYIEYRSAGVELAIVDYDHCEATGKSGDRVLRYWIARAKRDEKGS